MKKTIESLVQKLRENNDGTLQGGFGSIRGGFNTDPVGTNNVSCTNDATGGCSGTNERDCSNKSSCGSSTNYTGCTNSGTCFA